LLSVKRKTHGSPKDLVSGRKENIGGIIARSGSCIANTCLCTVGKGSHTHHVKAERRAIERCVYRRGPEVPIPVDGPGRCVVGFAQGARAHAPGLGLTIVLAGLTNARNKVQVVEAGKGKRKKAMNGPVPGILGKEERVCIDERMAG
jgi:hypothetical protein